MNIDHSIAQATDTDKLSASKKLKLQKAVREFESVFVGYMLKGMRNTIQKADNSSDGFGADMLEGMFDIEFAKHISKNSNLGLAGMLYRKMTGEEMPKAVVAKKSSVAQPVGVSQTSPKVVPTAEVKKVEPMQSVKSEHNFVVPKVLATQPQPKLEELVSLRPKAAVQDVVQIVSKNELKSDDKALARRSQLEERLHRYDKFIAEASEKHGVSAKLIKAVIASESGGRPNVESNKQAKGLMQLIDTTAAAMGVKNVWSPRENIFGGTKYLGQLLKKFDGDEKLALASYNAGPGNVIKHGGIPPFKETKEYVARVMNFVKLFEENDNE